MNSLQKKLAASGLAGSVAIAGALLIAPYEGKVNEVYLDPIDVLTSCYGHTGKELKIGQTFTDEQCLEQLIKDLSKHNRLLLSVVKVHLSEGEHAAYLSFVYNVGIGNLQTSAALKLLHAGQRKDACIELVRFVYAGRNLLRGLLNRRIDEAKICIKDL